MFSTNTLAAEERFVREYLVPALADLNASEVPDEGGDGGATAGGPDGEHDDGRAHGRRVDEGAANGEDGANAENVDGDGCEGDDGAFRVRFFRYGLDPELPGGEVRLTIEGAYEPVVARERARWDRWREAGVVETWTVEATADRLADSAAAHLGTAYGDVASELQFLAAETGVALLDAFDGRLAPVGDGVDPLPPASGALGDGGESPQAHHARRARRVGGDGAESVPVGWWLFVHYVANVQGYSWDEEIDACLQAILSRLRSLAHHEGTDYALRRTEELRQSVDEFEGLLVAEDRR